MLTGGSGDGNLEPRAGNEGGLEETVTRVRTLLKFGALAKGPQVDARGKERDEVIVARWKAIFQKYDSAGSGILTLSDVRRMVRGDLKISERLVSDAQLQQVFETMDEDCGGSIEFDEFMKFVQKNTKRVVISVADAMNAVARAVRLALHRNKIRISELEDKFHSYDDLDPLTGELGPQEMRRFFRNVLRVGKHECSDRNLAVAFRACDDDGSGTMSADEFMSFIKDCHQGTPIRQPPQRLQGMIAGQRDAMLEPFPRHRPGTLQNMPLATLPFCLNGRELPAAHRITLHCRWPGSPGRARVPGLEGRSSQRDSAMASAVGSAIASTLSTAVPSPKGPGPAEPPSGRLLGQSLSGALPVLTAPPQAGGLPPLAPGLGRPGSAPQLPSSRQKDRLELSGAMRQFAVPQKPLGNYRTFKGAKALNRVEQQLFEVGVDARGQYHRLR